MTKCDAHLGEHVFKHLVDLKLETSLDFPGATDQAKIEEAFGTIMEHLKLDMSNDSLEDTPARVAKMYVNEVFAGLNYNNFPKCTTIQNDMKMDEVVCVRNIAVKSMCEHHFVPFLGTATIAYIPKKRIIGLSKFNRVVDFFSRRPQVQERLTEQVHAALCYILGTPDVAVYIDAEHLCVKLRGVQDGSNTVTSKVGGRFKTKAALRAEFLSMIK